MEQFQQHNQQIHLSPAVSCMRASQLSQHRPHQPQPVQIQMRHVCGNVHHQQMELGHQLGFTLAELVPQVYVVNHIIFAKLVMKILMVAETALFSHVKVIAQLNALEEAQPLQDAEVCYVNAIVLAADSALRIIAK